jgi:phosphocarrier protein
MQTRKLVIGNPRGLHAQACAVGNGRRVSARSIVAVMMLTASVGTTVRIEAEGPDEEVAIREIATLFHDGLGERR